MEEQTTKLLSHQYFSHEHPLELTNFLPRKDTTCFGCNLTIFSGRYYYKCQTCPFNLHQVCHNMPKKVEHPCDPSHHFTLHYMPNNPKVPINCKACGHNLSGLYYNCAKCRDFYHILCSAVPLSVKTPHHQHILKLEYKPPYDFQCDLCNKPSYSGWLYRCNSCEFDVHMSCAITNKGAQLTDNQMTPQSPENKELELMELLTRGLMNKQEIVNDEKSNEDGEKQVPFSTTEDPSFVSHQFSDACFSIDFATSLLGNTEDGTSQASFRLPEVKETESARQSSASIDPKKYTISKQTSVASSNGESMNLDHQFRHSSSNGLKVSLSSSAGSHIWSQLDPETEKKNVSMGSRNRTASAIHQKTSKDSGNRGCSHLTRGFVDLFYLRRSKSKKVVS